MKIICIFEGKLWAFKYDNDNLDVWYKLLELWTDVEFLLDFFEKNQEDLKYFKLNIEEAIEQTINQAERLRKEFEKIAKSPGIELSSKFQNLHNNKYQAAELVKQKVKQKWLRLYALKIEEGQYILTGGAIKLTLEMKDRNHTAIELQRLDNCRNYLQSQNVFDSGSFQEFIIE